MMLSESSASLTSLLTSPARSLSMYSAAPSTLRARAKSGDLSIACERSLEKTERESYELRVTSYEL